MSHAARPKRGSFAKSQPGSRSGAARPVSQGEGTAAPDAGPLLRRAVPILPCRDVARALEFYAERLGFAPSFQFEHCAGVTRDGIEIHLRLAGEIPKGSGCRIEVRAVDLLRDEMEAQGVVLDGTGHGVRGPHEFTVSDGDGNRIVFMEDRSASESRSR